MKLNPKQKRFCAEYIIDLNATRAAIRAKYSRKNAAIHGCRLLIKANIQKEIKRLMAKRAERTEITQDMVLKELALLGFSDLKNYVDIDPLTGAIQAKGFDAMPKESSKALRSIKEDRVIKEDADGKKVTVYDKVRFELWDKPKALELIGKHLGMYIEKHEHTVNPVLSVARLRKSLEAYSEDEAGS